MNIGIDARMLGPHCGGLGRYTEQLIKHLIKIDSKNQYILFLKKDNFNFVPDSQNVIKVLADIHWYGIKEQTDFLKIINKQDIDLMHFPHWNVPLLYNKPFVVTIHDLLLLHYPTREASTLGFVWYAVKHAVYKKVLHHAVKKAKHIFVPSNFTKMDLCETLNVRQEKITVTYEAPYINIGDLRNTYIENKNHQFSSTVIGMQKEIVRNTQQNIFEKYNITKPYVLYVGVAYPHKNLKGLLRTWKKVEHEIEDVQLVLVGKRNFFYEQLLSSEEIRLCSRVIYTDFVGDAELSNLYKNARAYVFPSLYEGFGLPPLEAMAHGVPVVSSNRTCLPEILGEAVLYVDSENADQFAQQIILVLENEDLRFELRSKAIEELKKYSWEKMAKETFAIYQNFLNSFD